MCPGPASPDIGVKVSKDMPWCRGNEGFSTQQGEGGGQSGVIRALGVIGGVQWDSNDMLGQYCVHGERKLRYL